VSAIGRFAPALALVLAGALTSCISNRPYRVTAPVLHETPPLYCPAGGAHYTLSFIEFDDMGELWDPGELQSAIQTIRDARDQAPLVVLFVHGWKNNASDKSGNVSGFRCELGSIAARYQRNVIGVYFGWRGDITNVQFFKNFTFWNRINAATRIPGAHMTDAIVTIMRETKENDRGGEASLILVGHSFGGLVLERAVTQALVERIEEAETATSTAAGEFRFPADLVVFLNEAGPALQAKQLLDTLYREGAEFSTEAGQRDPLLLSLTSKGDTATHLAFPGGQALSLYKVSLRKYLATGSDKAAPDEFGIADQRTYYLHTAANTDALQSHVIGRQDDPAVKAALAEGKAIYATADLGGGRKFLIVPKAAARNTTPYWIMQMPGEFVPDHSTIFRPEFEALLIAFLDKRPDMMLRSKAASPPGPRLRRKASH